MLELGEAGIGDRLKITAGVWRYSDRFNDQYWTDQTDLALPIQRTSHGIYGTAEYCVFGDDEGAKLSVFGRVGRSDGHTTPFRGSMQAGALLERPLKSRPNSALSVGIHRASLGSSYRLAQYNAGVLPTHKETTIEVTYSDQIVDHVSVQPDLQYVIHPGGVYPSRNAFIATVRTSISF